MIARSNDVRYELLLFLLCGSVCACASQVDPGQGGAAASSSTAIGTTVASSSTGSVGCDAGFKLCDAECVAIDDPLFGCGVASCAPCGPHAIYECENSACVFDRCALGYGNCDGIAANGCEARLDSDPNACGTCGRSCLGATCTDGLCAPQIMVTEQDLPPIQLAVDGTSIYWTNNFQSGYRIRRAGKDGGAPVTLFETQAAGQVPLDLAVDETGVYWITTNAVNVVPKNGGPVTTLAGGSTDVVSMATNTQYVFFRSNNGLSRIAKSGGAVTNLVAPDLMGTSERIAVGGDRVFWFNPRPGPENQGMGVNQVYGVPIEGGSPVEVSAGTPDDLGGLWITTSPNGSEVYWSENYYGMRIKKAPATGGPAELFVETQGGVRTFMTTSDSVVWADSKGLFQKVAPAAPPDLLYPHTVTKVVADSELFYFISSTNAYQIVRVPR